MLVNSSEIVARKLDYARFSRDLFETIDPGFIRGTSLSIYEAIYSFTAIYRRSMK